MIIDIVRPHDKEIIKARDLLYRQLHRRSLRLEHIHSYAFNIKSDIYFSKGCTKNSDIYGISIISPRRYTDIDKLKACTGILYTSDYVMLFKVGKKTTTIGNLLKDLPKVPSDRNYIVNIYDINSIDNYADNIINDIIKISDIEYNIDTIIHSVKKLKGVGISII